MQLASETLIFLRITILSIHLSKKSLINLSVCVCLIIHSTMQQKIYTDSLQSQNVLLASIYKLLNKILDRKLSVNQNK